MKRLIHSLYMLLGHCVCRIILAFCVIRDKIIPPKEETLIIVTHPDDDVLFFHTAIKEYNPYIVLMATGWSIKRLIVFFKNREVLRS